MAVEVRFCRWCGRKFWFSAAPSSVARGQGKYCTKQCSMRGILTGKRSRNWRGGRHVKSDSGHVLLHIPDHPDANGHGYVQEHRLIAAGTIGRLLRPGEVVHHINGNPADNSPENLMVLSSQSEHMRVHMDPAYEQKRLEWEWMLWG